MIETIVRLADQIKSKKRKSKAYEIADGGVSPDVARFLYTSNGYIKRGVNNTRGAIIRPWFETITKTRGDEKIIEEFVKTNHLYHLMHETVLNVILHGYQFWELYDGENGPEVALIPVDETDFKRNEQNEVIFDKFGKPEGVVQKRKNEVLAEWKYNDLAHFYLDRLHIGDLGHSMLEPVVAPATGMSYIRNNIAESFIRSMPVVHMIVEGATGEDIEEVTESLSTQFTAETVYVTSERYAIETKSTTAYNIEIFNFTEPLISEIASAFDMPIELICATKHLKSADFEYRYIEWIAAIREMQNMFAHVLADKVFSRITKKPVEVKFNDPAAVTPDQMLSQVGFAMQSEAITSEDARKILEDNHLI